MVQEKESPSIIIGGPPPTGNELKYDVRLAGFYRGRQAGIWPTNFAVIGKAVRDCDPDGEKLRNSPRADMFSKRREDVSK